MTSDDSVASAMSESISPGEVFFRISPDLIAVIRLNGRFKRVNPSFSNTLGYFEAELQDHSFLDFVHPDDYIATLAELETLNGEQPASYFENRYQTQDGNYRWLEWNLMPQPEQDLIYCIARDITQQKHMEESLRVSEERWQLALRGSNDGIWDWNVQTDEVFFSTRWKTMLGYEEHDIENHLDEWEKRVHPDDLAPVVQALQDHFAKKTPFYVTEHRVLCKDGTYKWILDRGQAIWDEAGNVLRMVGSHTDITQRRELEAALQQATKNLEQRVNKRTIQLAHLNAALQESEERNQLAMEVARMFTFEWEPTTDIVKRSPQCGGILGLTDDAIEQDTGSNFFQRVHPDDRDRFIAQLRALTPENNVYKTTYRVVRPDGQVIVLEESGRALFDSQGQLVRLLGMTADITERQRLEAELETSRATLQQQLAEIEAIYQSAPIGLNFLDPDLRFVRINQRLAEINGVSIEDHIGKTVRDVVPNLADAAEAVLRPILETGEPLLNVELQGETPAQPGVQRVWLESFLPLKDGDRVIGINTVCEEITERKQTEEALRQGAARLAFIVDAAQFGIWEVDLRSQPYLAHPRSLKHDQIFGYDTLLPEWTYETFISHIHPDDRPLVAESFQQTITTYIDWNVECRIIRADGQHRWVWIRGSIDRDVSGKPTALMSLIADITERKQAEQRLRENEDRLRMAIASAQLGTWDWNIVSGELKWDAGCKTMFGLPLDTSTNMDIFFEGVHPDDRTDLQDIIQRCLDPISGGAFDAEYRIVGLQDQVERWVRAKGQAYYDPNGTPLRFSGTVLDITDQKHAEAHRERLLQQEQALREAAERANRMKDEFLAVLSHELRTPLNPILGWAKLLQSPQIKPDKLLQGLTTIERNAKQQVQLIEDLLDISRIIRGKLTLHFGTVNLSEPITAALETVRLAADAKSIRLEAFLDPSVGPIRGDAGRLQQVVWNLLSNAVKFTPSGGQVTVRLQLVEQDAAGKERNRPTYAQITVSDTGKGIDPNFLPHVFELFQQQDSSTTRSFGGLGLGLAIARQVVEAHGGSINAASNGEGQGAIFTVQLPLIPDPQIEQQGTVQAPMPNFRGLRVLAVDDEIDSAELVKVLLEEEGATVHIATSAATALHLLTQNQFDLLITDIGMPEMDGYKLMREIRVLPAHLNRTVPAIALTAYAGESNQRQILAAGFQTHLTKPIEPQQLLEAITMVMAR